MTKARDLANGATALSAVSATELAYLDGVTSAVQTQIDGKQAVNAAVSTTELGYLDGVTSAIQTQLDSKTAKSTLTTTGDIYYASAANTPARLGIGSTGNVLTVASGIPSWAAPAGGGKVLQVVSATTTTGSTISTTTFTDTGVTATITPTSASSKIYVIVSQQAQVTNATSYFVEAGYKLLRDATAIISATGDAFMNSTFTASSPTYTRYTATHSITYLDNPATTSATTYKMQVALASGISGTPDIQVQRAGGASTITLLEIGA